MESNTPQDLFRRSVAFRAFVADEYFSLPFDGSMEDAFKFRLWVVVHVHEDPDETHIWKLNNLDRRYELPEETDAVIAFANKYDADEFVEMLNSGSEHVAGVQQMPFSDMFVSPALFSGMAPVALVGFTPRVLLISATRVMELDDDHDLIYSSRSFRELQDLIEGTRDSAPSLDHLPDFPMYVVISQGLCSHPVYNDEINGGKIELPGHLYSVLPRSAPVNDGDGLFSWRAFASSVDAYIFCKNNPEYTTVRLDLMEVLAHVDCCEVDGTTRDSAIDHPAQECSGMEIVTNGKVVYVTRDLLVGLSTAWASDTYRFGHIHVTDPRLIDVADGFTDVKDALSLEPWVASFRVVVGENNGDDVVLFLVTPRIDDNTVDEKIEKLRSDIQQLPFRRRFGEHIFVERDATPEPYFDLLALQQGLGRVIGME